MHLIWSKRNHKLGNDQREKNGAHPANGRRAGAGRRERRLSERGERWRTQGQGVYKRERERESAFKKKTQREREGWSPSRVECFELLNGPFKIRLGLGPFALLIWTWAETFDSTHITICSTVIRLLCSSSVHRSFCSISRSRLSNL